jgi:Tfp pilus assembly protein PilN
VAQGLQVPWADLLGALEAASGESVALLTVEPSTQQQTVRLTAEARDPHSMLRYLSTLQGDARLSQVVLVSHAVQTQAPGTPVRFQLQAHWGAQP